MQWNGTHWPVKMKKEQKKHVKLQKCNGLGTVLFHLPDRKHTNKNLAEGLEITQIRDLAFVLCLVFINQQVK